MLDELYILPILLLSVVVHEVAHGWVALKLGDPTAYVQGRLTLNPIPHVDLVGSIIIPLFSIFAAGHVFIAWAKPVPVNPSYFHQPRRDNVLVSIAGPLSNFIVAFICCLITIGIALMVPADGIGAEEGMMAGWFSILVKMFYGGVYLNIVLAVFNMIPVPPLDGSHVLAGFLPPRIAEQYQRIGFLGVIVVIFLMRVPQFSGAFALVVGTLFAPFRALIETIV